MALTLKPIKKLCTIYTMQLVRLDGLRLSHLQRRCHCKFLGGSVELCSPVGSLWHFGRRLIRNSLCLFTATPCDGPLSSVLGGVSNRLFKLESEPGLAVRGSLLSLWEDSSELLPVTPLAFPDLALDLLGWDIALPLGGSGVDVLNLLVHYCLLTCHLNLLLQ